MNESSQDESNDEDVSRVYSIRLHPRARADVDEAYQRLIDISGQTVAEDWEEGLYTALASLARLPERRPIAPESTLFSRFVRELVYRRRARGPAYRILFVVQTAGLDGSFVYVLHIRHGARAPMTDEDVRDLNTEF